MITQLSDELTEQILFQLAKENLLYADCERVSPVREFNV